MSRLKACTFSLVAAAISIFSEKTSSRANLSIPLHGIGSMNGADRGLKASSVDKIAVFADETECRTVASIRSDQSEHHGPAWRALSTQNKAREAIKFYLEAADRRHAGAMKRSRPGIRTWSRGAEKTSRPHSLWYKTQRPGPYRRDDPSWVSERDGIESHSIWRMRSLV